MWNNWHDSLIHWCCILSRNSLDSLHGVEFERNDKTFSHLCHHVRCPLEAPLCAWPCLSVKVAVAVVQVGGEIFTEQLKITKSCQHHGYHSDFCFLSLGWERCPGMLSKALLIWPWFFSHTDAEIGCRLPKCTRELSVVLVFLLISWKENTQINALLLFIKKKKKAWFHLFRLTNALCFMSYYI